MGPWKSGAILSFLFSDRFADFFPIPFLKSSPNPEKDTGAGTCQLLGEDAQRPSPGFKPLTQVLTVLMAGNGEISLSQNVEARPCSQPCASHSHMLSPQVLF